MKCDPLPRLAQPLWHPRPSGLLTRRLPCASSCSLPAELPTWQGRWEEGRVVVVAGLLGRLAEICRRTGCPASQTTDQLTPLDSFSAPAWPSPVTCLDWCSSQFAGPPPSAQAPSSCAPWPNPPESPPLSSMGVALGTTAHTCSSPHATPCFPAVS